MRKKEIEFHVKSKDYFGNLATALDLISQTLEKCGNSKNEIESLKQLAEDLLYLQEKYIIRQIPSTKNL